MKSFLKTLLGVVKTLLLIVNLLIFPVIAIVLAIIRLLPIKPLKKITGYLIYEIVAPIYISINQFIIQFGNNTQWDITVDGELKHDGWYFLMANHISWADIPILQAVFNRKIPLLKFFMKKELLWSLPVIGVACWLVDFPVMHRHSKEYLKKHPEQRNKDMETTRKKCEIFKTEPVTIFNFLEGTRFTPEKHKLRHSTYQYLLPPKAGGMAFTLAAMEGVLHDIIDVTVYYLPENKSMWDLLCDKVDKIIVHIEVLPIPDALRGNYSDDKDFRLQFQSWLNDRWQQKDQWIGNALSKYENRQDTSK